MDFTIEKIKIGGAVAVAGASSLASAYSSMPVELAVPVNTLIMAAVGLFIRWVEKKIFKEKVKKELQETENETHGYKPRY
jgi:hypothetical protein